MRLAAQERRREGNEPQTTKVAHYTTYPLHEVFAVESEGKDADAALDARTHAMAGEGRGDAPLFRVFQGKQMFKSELVCAAVEGCRRKGMEVEVMRGAGKEGLNAEGGREKCELI